MQGACRWPGSLLSSVRDGPESLPELVGQGATEGMGHPQGAQGRVSAEQGRNAPVQSLSLWLRCKCT